MTVLVLVRSDPETSPRATEALRVALGLMTGPLEVEVLFLGPGVKALGPEPWTLRGGDEMAAHRRGLAAGGVPFLAEREALGRWPADPGLSCTPLEGGEAALRLARADRLLPF